MRFYGSVMLLRTSLIQPPPIYRIRKPEEIEIKSIDHIVTFTNARRIASSLTCTSPVRKAKILNAEINAVSQTSPDLLFGSPGYRHLTMLRPGIFKDCLARTNLALVEVEFTDNLHGAGTQ